MRRGIAFSATALALTTGLAAPAAASAPSPAHGPDGVTVEIASVNGSGCPPGTVAVALSDDRELLTLAYSDYTARVGGSSKPIDARKNCQVALQVNVPQGFTYAVASTTHRGYADLQSGAKATIKSTYYFQGGRQPAYHKFDMGGPLNDTFQFVNEVSMEYEWKPCDKDPKFNVNTELRTDKGASDSSQVSSISMNREDGAKATYHLRWSRCP